MCRTILFVAILALIIALQSTASALGYRHVTHLNGNNITPRFAEYQAPGCVDLFGNPKEDYKDYSPMVRKCYNIDIRTCTRNMVAKDQAIARPIGAVASRLRGGGSRIMCGVSEWVDLWYIVWLGVWHGRN
ncbi:hypothetical protein F5882DRAFT_377270 [Hyaloscypha sp. PMI_1271]|nr:hypothetical protein F5882DRAFT_377270 [Hyaloscypha sp. PMI_1271]